jgi:2-polyprenyl-3-methyl-5-hydroxy-6-metoxy-1,4-benzoquinol methylase
LIGLDIEIESARLRDAWQASGLPHKQRELVEQQLSRYRAGNVVEVFDVFTRALQSLPDLWQMESLLEIGCSSGFYAEVMETAGIRLLYHGCDYSPAFIEMARARYPAVQFRIADACSLTYKDNEFDVVVSGGCLLHIPEYELAIAETARVARRYAIFHRTPILLDQPTCHYRKFAYGQETMEIHFNEVEFLGLLKKHDLCPVSVLFLEEGAGPRGGNRTYVCKRT